MVGVPLFTNVLLGGNALEGGLNLMRLTIALPVGALTGGWLASRVGLSGGAAVGLILAAVGFLGMATWSEDPSMIELTLPLLVAGLGFGLVIAPINAAVMNEAPEAERATLASLADRRAARGRANRRRAAHNTRPQRLLLPGRPHPAGRPRVRIPATQFAGELLPRHVHRHGRSLLRDAASRVVPRPHTARGRPAENRRGLT